jgi:hypothetical protein
MTRRSGGKRKRTQKNALTRYMPSAKVQEGEGVQKDLLRSVIIPFRFLNNKFLRGPLLLWACTSRNGFICQIECTYLSFKLQAGCQPASKPIRCLPHALLFLHAVRTHTRMGTHMLTHMRKHMSTLRPTLAEMKRALQMLFSWRWTPCCDCACALVLERREKGGSSYSMLRMCSV